MTRRWVRPKPGVIEVEQEVALVDETIWRLPGDTEISRKDLVKTTVWSSTSLMEGGGVPRVVVGVRAAEIGQRNAHGAQGPHVSAVMVTGNVRGIEVAVVTGVPGIDMTTDAEAVSFVTLS